MAALYEEVLAASQPRHRDAADALARVDRGFDGLLTTLQEAQRRLRTTILDAADLLNTCLAQEGKVLICGNGGSAADAQHFASELVGRFKAPDRPGLPVISLTADTALLTAWANDIGYDQVFARQVEALGRPGDVLVAISTSGRSRNLVQAFEAARHQGMRCLALLGRDGGDLRALADVAVIVPSDDTQHIQETQILVVHLLCELIEEAALARQAPAATAGTRRTLWSLPARRAEPAPRRVRHSAARAATS